MPDVDLTKVSSDDLRAELDRRKQAAKASGKPMRYATKAEWAQAQLDQFEATKNEIRQASGTGSDMERRKRRGKYEALDEQIRKFRGLVDFYTRKGL